MNARVFNEEYRKLSIFAMITGIAALSFCVLYFLIWTLFDDFLTPSAGLLPRGGHRRQSLPRRERPGQRRDQARPTIRRGLLHA